MGARDRRVCRSLGPTREWKSSSSQITREDLDVAREIFAQRAADHAERMELLAARQRTRDDRGTPPDPTSEAPTGLSEA